MAVGCGGPGYVGIYARTAPPPIRVESYGPAPGAGYVWIKGYWGYRGNDYVWNAGRWERPPRGRRHWEDGRWEHRGNRYVWHEGTGPTLNRRNRQPRATGGPLNSRRVI
jgi:hypothetical protein